MTTSYVCLYDPSFPSASGALPSVMRERLASEWNIVQADHLAEALDAQQGGVLINLHAPYFPKSAWTSIAAFLERGGHLLSAGGSPFRIPVYRDGSGWTAEPEQTAYHQRLRIHECMPVQADRFERFAANVERPLFEQAAPLWPASPTCSFVLWVTRHDDCPGEHGSAGPMDAHIIPLVTALDRDGREVGAPVVLLENTKGDFAGTRWLFVNQPLTAEFLEQAGAETLLAWARYCSYGVSDWWLKPGRACYEPGERPKLTLQTQLLHAARASYGAGGPLAASRRSAADAAEADVVWQASVELTADDGEVLWRSELAVRCGRELERLTLTPDTVLAPGMYRVNARLVSGTGEVRLLRQGFWCRDEALLRSGSFLKAGRDYFERDGVPVPIVGMTYMSSDVARKFVFLPNAAVWDRDMAQMKKAGINLIRTGIWTAYRHVMYVDGHPSEDVLCALDAFFLTAKKHGIEVCFNFFSFAPELWEGSNPYLDPRSIEAQKRFIGAVVERHRHSSFVHWDLINEPSLFDPKRVFAGPRSAKDKYEIAAFRDWLKERFAGDIRLLQERWGMTPEQVPGFHAIVPPEPQEINFDAQDMIKEKKGTRWLDYSLFTMEMLNRWVHAMRDTISFHQPEQLVCVGQDEALAAQRPSPFFYEASVDYTSNHSWWLYDQLIWDGVFTKTPYKPNLIQETGIMYGMTPDGFALRTEEQLRSILERKYAYAFATGCAGAVQWIWNTNFYMNNVNESNIGALRADGTEKPEADVSYDFGAFMQAAAPLFRDRELEPIVVIYPEANDLSNRRMAAEATSTAARVLAYQLKVPFRAMGEYQLEALDDMPPRLIIVPSPHHLTDAALDRLLAFVERSGAALLITGPLGRNEYWQATARMDSLLGPRRLGSVVREERFLLAGREIPLSFGGRKIKQVFKETNADGSPSTLVEQPIGRGKLLWVGLPVEWNDRQAAVAELYAHAMQTASIEPDLRWEEGGSRPGIYGRCLTFAQGRLYLFVSESGQDEIVRIAQPDNGTTYAFKLASERTVMFAADRQGELIAVYRPREVEIEVLK